MRNTTLQKAKEYIGKNINSLKIISVSDIQNNGDLKVLCMCKCGIQKDISLNKIIKNETMSCGCVGRSNVKISNSKEYGRSAFNSIYNEYKCGAKRRGLLFNLSKDEFRTITSKNCHYCGEEPSKIYTPKSNNGSFIYNGIDRVDSSIGYIPSNIVSCCSMCNYMKRTSSIDEFKQRIIKIFNNRDNF